MHHVYALKDPRTNEVVYIGQTKYPKNRLQAHKNGNKYNISMDELAKALKSERLDPIMVILSTHEYKEEAELQEKKAIRQFRKVYKILNEVIDFTLDEDIITLGKFTEVMQEQKTSPETSQFTMAFHSVMSHIMYYDAKTRKVYRLFGEGVEKINPYLFTPIK